MAIKSDKWIRRMALEHDMINPFTEKQVRAGVVSFGLSSYGYDLRVADEFKIFTNVNSAIVDPKKFDEKSFVTIQADSIMVPPNSFALARSVEYFKIPRDVLTICVGNSTYARCGIIVNVTPFEPEWEGFVTLEISNTTPLPAKVYANEGFCEILFFQRDEPCESSYKDRRGKYQKQSSKSVRTRRSQDEDDVEKSLVVRCAAGFRGELGICGHAERRGVWNRVRRDRQSVAGRQRLARQSGIGILAFHHQRL